MDKSTHSLKTYHAPIDKLQYWEKKPFYATYAPRTRIEDHETQVLPVIIPMHDHHGEVAIAVMVALLLVLVALGVLLVILIS